MEKSVFVKIKPNLKQKQQIEQTFGCSRFVFNHFLNHLIELYKSEKRFANYVELSRQLTQLKTQQEFSWLRDVSKWALQNTLKNLNQAYLNFFNKNAKKPRFKSKRNLVQSYKVNEDGNKTIEIKENKIKIPKLSWIKMSNFKDVGGRILSVTISRKPNGCYYAAILFTDVEDIVLPKTGKQVGLDLGLTHFFTASDGWVVENQRHFKQLEDRLARANQALSKTTKVEGRWSKHHEKALKKVRKVQFKIACKRSDFLHKLSTDIIKRYDLIVVEDLNVKGMEQNSRLAKHINDVSWSEFFRQLEYKAKFYGKTLIKVNRFFASSQLCSACGTKNEQVKDLSVRQWTCDCGAVHDRDLNAAKNILDEGLKQATN